MKSLKIAIIGTRGIPARYGGFETFAEELGAGLVARGHAVTVYGRRRFFEKGERRFLHRGVSVALLPTIRHKFFDTVINAIVSFLWVTLFARPDVVLVCNAANAPFAWILRLGFIPFAINVDGIERMRSKWNWLGRLWYRIGEKTSVLFAQKVVADAGVIARYYKRSHNCSPTVISYGARVIGRQPGDTLSELGIEQGKYLLYVSRLEPENNALGVIQAYKRAAPGMPLVIVGDAPYASRYKESLKKEASSGVIFAGFRFGEAYQELQSHCYAYVQATEVGGTHPALIEAMAYGNCVIANGTQENVEVLGEAGLFYWKNDFETLSERMKLVAKDPKLVSRLGAKAEERARKRYAWEGVIEQYEELFREITERKSS